MQEEAARRTASAAAAQRHREQDLARRRERLRAGFAEVRRAPRAGPFERLFALHRSPNVAPSLRCVWSGRRRAASAGSELLVVWSTARAREPVSVRRLWPAAATLQRPAACSAQRRVRPCVADAWQLQAFREADALVAAELAEERGAAASGADKREVARVLAAAGDYEVPLSIVWS